MAILLMGKNNTEFSVHKLSIDRDLDGDHGNITFTLPVDNLLSPLPESGSLAIILDATRKHVRIGGLFFDDTVTYVSNGEMVEFSCDISPIAFLAQKEPIFNFRRNDLNFKGVAEALAVAGGGISVPPLSGPSPFKVEIVSNPPEHTEDPPDPILDNTIDFAADQGSTLLDAWKKLATLYGYTLELKWGGSANIKLLLQDLSGYIAIARFVKNDVAPKPAPSPVLTIFTPGGPVCPDQVFYDGTTIKYSVKGARYSAVAVLGENGTVGLENSNGTIEDYAGDSVQMVYEDDLVKNTTKLDYDYPRTTGIVKIVEIEPL